MRKKMTVFIAVIMILDVIALGIIFFTRDMPSLDISSNAVPGAEPTTTEQQELFSRVSFVAVGDNLIHKPIYNQAAARTSGGYDFSYAYENFAERIAEPDVAILNQEAIISTEHNVSTYPMFNSPVELGEEMLEIGFDVFNIATNHSIDCGEKGLISAINFWKSKEAITCGAYLNFDDYGNIPMHEVNGVKIAYIGFTESTNGLSLPDDSEVILVKAQDEILLQNRVMKADEVADIVIVSAHWGNEYTHEPTQTQRDLAQKLASWGADVIIGTHPHVIQPIEYITNQD
ncbi:MAG: CapA family protein, partial [Clostridia bacterium]|nr:CapA family protein [Clostridia bacterium]